MKISKIFFVPVIMLITASVCLAGDFETEFVTKNNIKNPLTTNKIESLKDTENDSLSIPDNSEVGTVKEIPIYFKPYEKAQDEVIISSAKSWINVINPNTWNNKALYKF